MNLRIVGSRIARALLACLLATSTPSLADEIFVLEGENTGDLFGFSVATLGDVNSDGTPDFAVGAPSYNSVNGVNSGRVYIYSGATGFILRTFDGESANDQFGFSIAGDGNRIMIGAPLRNVNLFTDAGKVYIYDAFTGVPENQFDGEFAFDNLGHSVAFSDANNDGTKDYVLSAPFFNGPSGPESGKVYLRDGVTGAIIRTLLGEAGEDWFGWSVANAGLIDLDSNEDILVGAKQVDGPSGTDSGRAYVYSGFNGNALFTFDGTSSEDFFGNCVAGEGNIDGDQTNDLLVCAEFHSGSGGPDSGEVRVLAGDSGATLFSEDGEAIEDNFGGAAALIGDLDDDGEDEILIGAANHDGPKGVDSGKAYLYSGSTGTLLMTFHGDLAGDGLGNALTGISDVNADTIPDVIVGAANADNSGGANAGTVYVYSGNPVDHCNRGTVNWGNDNIQDVLFLNASSGGPTRTIGVAEGALLFGAIIKPEAGGNGKYVIHATPGTSTFTTMTILPKNLGTSCFQFVLNFGANPAGVWNTIGKENKVGASMYLDGTLIEDPPRASALFFKLTNGDPVNLPMGSVLTFQAIIIDPVSVSNSAASLTNAIILQIL